MTDTTVLTAQIDLTPMVGTLNRFTGVAEMIDSWVVDSPQMAEALADEVRRIDTERAALDQTRLSLTKPAREIQDRANGFFKPWLESLERASEAGRRKLLAWKRAEDARLAEEQRAQEAAARKARQEAEAKAAAERAKAEEAARQKEVEARAAAEAKAKAEAEGNRQAAQRAAAAEAKAREQAQAAIENGAAAAQAALIESAAAAPIHIATPALPKGASTREKWEAVPDPEFGDQWFLVLVRFIADHPQYIRLIDYNPSAGNALAKALKGAMQIDGLKAKDVGSIALRKRA